MRRIALLLAAVLVASSAFAQSDTERILLPVFTGPVHGAFGSEFHTDLRILNTYDQPVTIAGLTANCPACLPPPNQYTLGPGEELEPGEVLQNGTPGRFIDVPASRFDALAMNLRVYDVTRNALNFGTEIPLVPLREFLINQIVLVGVPTDARFRNTLRIYSTGTIDVLVTVGNRSPVKLKLSKAADLYDPAYGMFTDFPTNAGSVTVKIVADPDFVSLLPIEIPLWAFVTVTNNDTQTITTITPQP